MRRSRASKVSLRWAHEHAHTSRRWNKIADAVVQVFGWMCFCCSSKLLQPICASFGLPSLDWTRFVSLEAWVRTSSWQIFLFRHPLTPGSQWIVSADRWTARRNSNSKGASPCQHFPYMFLKVVACQQYQGPSECNLYSLPIKDSITLCEDAIDRLKAWSSVLFPAFAMMNNRLWFQFQPDPVQGSQTQLEKKLDTVVKAQTLWQAWWFCQLSPSLF